MPPRSRVLRKAAVLVLLPALSGPVVYADRAQAAPNGSYSDCLWKAANAGRLPNVAALQAQCTSPVDICSGQAAGGKQPCTSFLLVLAMDVLDASRFGLKAFPSTAKTAWDQVQGNPNLDYLACVQSAYASGDVMGSGACLDTYQTFIEYCAEHQQVSRGYCEAYFAGEAVRYVNHQESAEQ